MTDLSHDDDRPLKRQGGPLRQDSDELMAAVAELRDLEAQKRERIPTSPPFHELARKVERQAREIFHLAHEERARGEKARDEER